MLLLDINLSRCPITLLYLPTSISTLVLISSANQRKPIVPGHSGIIIPLHGPLMSQVPSWTLSRIFSQRFQTGTLHHSSSHCWSRWGACLLLTVPKQSKLRAVVLFCSLQWRMSREKKVQVGFQMNDLTATFQCCFLTKNTTLTIKEPYMEVGKNWSPTWSCEESQTVLFIFHLEHQNKKRTKSFSKLIFFPNWPV